MRSARPGAQRRARRQRARAHAKSRAQRRRHIAQRIAAAWAAPLHAKRSRGIRAQPLAARFTSRIDALHGKAGQKLHSFSLRSRFAFVAQSINGRVRDPKPPERMVCWRGFWPNPSRLSRENTTTYSGPVAVCGVRRPSRRFAADYPTEQENNTARSNPNVPAKSPEGTTEHSPARQCWDRAAASLLKVPARGD